MVQQKQVVAKDRTTFYLRTITKSGKSRYLSVGNILPTDWIACKVYIDKLTSDVIVLRLEQIR